VSSTDKQEPIQKCFRSLEYIFKFIIQSRVLFSRATGGQYEDSFKKDLYNVFTALNNMLAMSSEIILPTQVQCIDRLWILRHEFLTVVSGLLGYNAVLLGEQFLACGKRTVPSKHRKLLVQRHGITLQKTLIFRLWFVLFIRECDADIF
jgi:hypothetical protein